MNSFTIKKFKRNDEYIKNMLKNEIVYSDLAVFSEEYADFPVYVLHSEGEPILVATFVLYDYNQMIIPEEYLPETLTLESEVYLGYTRKLESCNIDMEKALDDIFSTIKESFGEFADGHPVTKTLCKKNDIEVLLEAYNESHNYFVTVTGLGMEKYEASLAECLLSLDKKTFEENLEYYHSLQAEIAKASKLDDTELAYGMVYENEYQSDIYIGDRSIASANITLVGNAAFLSAVYVDEEFRHHGLATDLLIFMIEEFFSEYDNTILLNLRSDNVHAFELYKKLKFKNIVEKNEFFVLV